MEPTRLVLDWLEAVTGDVTPRPWLTDEFDAPRGYPQLVVVYAAKTITSRRDGRLDDSFYLLNVGVASWGAAAARHDYLTAWDALTPVVDALVDLSGDGTWTATSGERVENAATVIVTESTDDESRQALVTATWQFRVRRL